MTLSIQTKMPRMLTVLNVEMALSSATAQDGSHSIATSKKDSIVVKKGQRVAMGAILGQVGLSGKTQFPHVHLSVRHNGTVVDPFDPDSRDTCNPEPPTDTL